MTIDRDAIRQRADRLAQMLSRSGDHPAAVSERAWEIATEDVPALLAKVDELTAALAAKDAVVESAKEWRRAVAETGDYEISDSDVLIAAIDALPKDGVL